LTAYEILLMLDPELPEDRGSEIVTRTRELIEGGGGTWRSHDPWGRRRLQYEIDHKGEGVYHLVVFESGAETLAEVTRVLKITDGVMRHLAVRHIEGSQTRAPREEPVVPEREYAGAGARSHDAPAMHDAPVAQDEPTAQDEPVAEDEPVAQDSQEDLHVEPQEEE
jgi:small subunit ribosomal protein S6